MLFESLHRAEFRQHFHSMKPSERIFAITRGPSLRLRKPSVLSRSGSTSRAFNFAMGQDKHAMQRHCNDSSNVLGVQSCDEPTPRFLYAPCRSTSSYPVTPPSASCITDTYEDVTEQAPTKHSTRMPFERYFKHLMLRMKLKYNTRGRRVEVIPATSGESCEDYSLRRPLLLNSGSASANTICNTRDTYAEITATFGNLVWDSEKGRLTYANGHDFNLNSSYVEVPETELCAVPEADEREELRTDMPFKINLNRWDYKRKLYADYAGKDRKLSLYRRMNSFKGRSIHRRANVVVEA